jgi:hypothetical protein
MKDAAKNRKQPALRVKNKLATVHDPARAADLFERILQSVRSATARRDLERQVASEETGSKL